MLRTESSLARIAATHCAAGGSRTRAAMYRTSSPFTSLLPEPVLTAPLNTFLGPITASLRWQPSPQLSHTKPGQASFFTSATAESHPGRVGTLVQASPNSHS